MSWILGHLHTTTVMITYVLLVTRKHMAAIPLKLQTNPMCCFHCPTMLHPLLGGESISLFSDASSLLLTDSKKKFQHYYITKTGFTPCHSLLCDTKGKFYNSCTNENWTGQPNFRIERALAQKWDISLNTEDFFSLSMTPTLPTLALFYSQH